MPFKLIRATAVALAVIASPAMANEQAVDEMAGYLDFVEYGGGVIFAEQIPREDWSRFHVIDARDAGQFAKDHIPGAINLEWRRVLAERDSIPRDKPVLIYCNTGSLSAQAGFALRVAGYENVRILQGGFEEWRAKGGFDAASKATGQAKH
ncbi:Sulfurtransferase [Thauera sp. GDN1]|uniref:rhodanese-like domain-containing protein n=1 Tax=Thauera sp. GDN1 TaxID=2944810 RepID=UPI00247B0AE1|nr:rhodanese-like domain-containing protein [Thauera sp. GDN1]WEN41673.1 Sulfurtransferase [Thauera sp. GDN1]